ncbi:MAG: hypothetical protein GC191_06245 [Azospirillum sp.]|nr:hypothetical protein [Azospirillum sp.]
MINAVERAVDIARAEQVAKHHYLDVAWKFAREAIGAKGPYEHATTLGELKAARETYDELAKASSLADRSQRDAE